MRSETVSDPHKGVFISVGALDRTGPGCYVRRVLNGKYSLLTSNHIFWKISSDEILGKGSKSLDPSDKGCYI